MKLQDACVACFSLSPFDRLKKIYKYIFWKKLTRATFNIFVDHIRGINIFGVADSTEKKLCVLSITVLLAINVQIRCPTSFTLITTFSDFCLSSPDKVDRSYIILLYIYINIIVMY